MILIWAFSRAKSHKDYMKTIIKKIMAALTPKPYNSFDTFITSKNPQTAADVEYWARIYERKNGGWIV